MAGFVKETDGIFRLCVPFEKIYTSVFLVESDGGAILVDCATTDGDVDGVILPALGEMGYQPSDLRAVILTHSHGDHAGGLKRLAGHAPRMRVLTEAGRVDGNLEIYPMAGHSADSVGVYDGRTGTLISGDGLQGAGVDRFRCLVRDKEAYRMTVDRIRNDGRIENLLFSHAYEPWNRAGIRGRDAVISCLDECLKYI